MNFGTVKLAARGGSVHGMAGKPRRMILIEELGRHLTGKPAAPVQKTDLILHR
ncbi:MAG TPA: hypothetical protein VFA87_07250 [Rhizomicrobium sp.]|nr:hypothetical protein [Rhizomicrobium sp.]